ncbi:MAG: flippase [Bacteroidota bacterium]
MKKIFNSYWIRSGFYTLGGKIFEAAFGLLSFFFLIRTLDKPEFGVWALFMTVSGLTESLRNAFVYNPLIRFINTHEDADHAKIIAASIVQNGLFTLVSSGLIFLLAPYAAQIWDAPSIIMPLHIFCLSNVVLAVFAQFNFIQQAYLQFKGMFYSFLFRRGLFFAFALYCYIDYREVALEALASSHLIILLLSLPIGYFFSRQFIKIHFKAVKLWLGKLVGFGKFTVGTNLTSVLFTNIDAWMLGSLISTKAVASYNPAVKVLTLIEVPVGSLMTVSYPQMTRKIKEQGASAARQIYEKSVSFIIALMIPLTILVIIFSDLIVTLIAGNEYQEAGPILQITALFGLFIPFNRQFGVVMNALGKAHINLRFVLANLVVSVVANYFFISAYGVIGAALGTLTTYFLSFVYGQLFLFFHLKIKTSNILIDIFKFYRNPVRSVKENLKRS